jgi:hypothetical protein
MNAASVAVPTVITADVLIATMMLIEASGSSIRIRRASRPSPRTKAISRRWRSIPMIPA